MNRQQRAAWGEETVSILRQGYYTFTSGQRVSVQPALQQAVEHTVQYKADAFGPLFAQRDESSRLHTPSQTQFELTGESTLEAAERLSQAGERLFCLNFASAKNPGGGFLSGAQSQEESLARSSGLYACQMANFDFYETHRNEKGGFYSDATLYSPNVPVFRRDTGQLLEKPYVVSFLTSPAVNAGVVRKQTPNLAHTSDAAMRRRLEKVLTVALLHGYTTPVLGAWGCGVFQNSPTVVAACFRHHLLDNPTFANRFWRVVFAVYAADNARNLDAFKQAFQP